MTSRALFSTILVSFSLACGSASAQGQAGIPDPTSGRDVAGRLCSSCHATDPAAASIPRADVPPFASIANRPGMTEERLAGAIIIPHPAMPGVPLTRAEIRDIIAYIVSLRRTP